MVREEPTPVSDLMSGHLIREHIIETAKEMSVSLQIITGYELHIIMNVGITFTFHKVMAKISMVGQNLMVGHVLLGGKSDQSYLVMLLDTYL